MEAKRMAALSLILGVLFAGGQTRLPAKKPLIANSKSVVLAPIPKIVKPVSIIPPRPEMAAERIVAKPEVGMARPAARTLRVVATGYALGDGSGKTTFTGTQVHWGVVAVDPKTIPLGSRIRLELPAEDSNAPMASRIAETTFVAEDTGRLVRGDHIDIWFPKLRSALDWGVRQLEVAVLTPDSKKKGETPS